MAHMNSSYAQEPTNWPDYWGSTVLERVFVRVQYGRAPFHYHRDPSCRTMTSLRAEGDQPTDEERAELQKVHEVNRSRGKRHEYIFHAGLDVLYEDVPPCSMCADYTPSYGLETLLARGLCHVADTDLSHLFFGKFYGKKPSDNAQRALNICRNCPVIRECRDYADEQELTFGIWGGEPAYERKERWNAATSG